MLFERLNRILRPHGLAVDQHKLKYSEPTQLDDNQLKARTIIALDKLGHQKFSAESGGYSLESWVRGVGLLLDEFEAKIGEARLPSGYVEQRRLLTDYLHRPIDTSAIDNRMSDLKQKEAEVVRKLGEERARTESRIDELQDELARCSSELEKEKARSVKGAAPERSRSFFGRLFGRTPASASKDPQNRFKESETRLQFLSGEIAEQRKILKSIEQRSPTSPLAEDWKTLESLQTKVRELEDERLERIQLVKEREEITTSIADIISGISLDKDGKGGNKQNRNWAN
jgi:hypothetical protein